MTPFLVLISKYLDNHYHNDFLPTWKATMNITRDQYPFIFYLRRKDNEKAVTIFYVPTLTNEKPGLPQKHI